MKNKSVLHLECRGLQCKPPSLRAGCLLLRCSTVVELGGGKEDVDYDKLKNLEGKAKKGRAMIS